MIRTLDVFEWIECLQRVYAENRQLLTDLDAAIGDADHGINMDRGFARVKAELGSQAIGDIGGLLKTVAMILIKHVGGAAGPLYGTFFLRAGTVCAGRDAIDSAGMVAMLSAGLEGVMQRGKAGRNEKTMVDALGPCIERMQQLLEQGAELAEILKQGSESARHGMESTVPMLAKKGRASYLGERSVGHQDPGATSAYLLIQTMAECFGPGTESG